MIELINSGLPLYMDEESDAISLGGFLKFDGMGRKTVAEMTGLLRDEKGSDPDEKFYDVYRGIRYPEDEKLLDSHDIRYDITVIMPGQVNGEYKKTSGHYHGWNPEHTNTYGEVYEVIAGTAMFVLQKAELYGENNTLCRKVEDLIYVTVPAGQTLLVPPNYGHCSINIGEAPLVFSNLAYTKCPVVYDSVKHYHGMAYYVVMENDAPVLKFNEHYAPCEVPEPKFATVTQCPELGIDFSKGVYLTFREHPERFDFLPHPDMYIDRIMELLRYGWK